MAKLQPKHAAEYIGCPTRYRTRLAGGPLLRVATIRRTTDTLLFISHTTNILLFKFRCNIFIVVRIIKEMPGSVASGTHCIRHCKGLVVIECSSSLPPPHFKFACDSSVSIATSYGLDGPGIESREGGARFSAPVQTGPGAHPASHTMGTGFPRG